MGTPAQVGSPCPHHPQLKRPADMIGKQSSTGPPCCLQQKLLMDCLLALTPTRHHLAQQPARLLQRAGPCHRARCTLSLGSLQTLGPLACPLKAEQTDFESGKYWFSGRDLGVLGGKRWLSDGHTVCLLWVLTDATCICLGLGCPPSTSWEHLQVLQLHFQYPHVFGHLHFCHTPLF